MYNVTLRRIRAFHLGIFTHIHTISIVLTHILFFIPYFLFL